jgi:peptidoglycan/xylan/chitin deacetylase (PgdA/CDA1 family)
MQLRELGQSLRGDKLKSRSVIVTFDDGYADNFLEAKPLLERRDMPATMFLATGYIDSGREFWWDELHRIFLEPGQLSSALTVTINGCDQRWELGQTADYSAESRLRYQNWRAWEEKPTSRHVLYTSLYHVLNPLPERERRMTLDKLLSWASVDSTARSTHRPLSLDEAVTLTKSGLIEVGSHTVTHPTLSSLPLSDQREEITESKEFLEELVGHQIESFAYPFGRRIDYTNESVTLVREAGFVQACSNFVGLVQRTSDAFQLPRLQVKDWDGDEFARRLSEWRNN